MKFLGFLPGWRVLGFLLNSIFLYIIPLFFTGWLTHPSDLVLSLVSEDEIWPLGLFVGTPFEYAGHRVLFIPFRVAYICSLMFANNFVGMGLNALAFKN